MVIYILLDLLLSMSLTASGYTWFLQAFVQYEPNECQSWTLYFVLRFSLSVNLSNMSWWTKRPGTIQLAFSFIAVLVLWFFLIQWCLAEVIFFVRVYKKRIHDTWSGVDRNTKNSDSVLKYILIHFYCMCILPECLKWRFW